MEECGHFDCDRPATSYGFCGKDDPVLLRRAAIYLENQKKRLTKAG
ncbi:hypothetical protein SEA_ARCHIE_37 [Mycobacterium phage Archie]|uniref:Uncharacterized protein n=1 Tax=Mycobacterium phage Archie TaxID=1718599 RepID=A0A0M4QU20_9CAUD|nr:hypothetical protein AVU85_gp037 [Mycobacterium phage Archie]ALF00343.1 hypothetical protein SEA_ARCHIE_37 [Mycobacterium phage Archie]